jgi:hypothetical protein
MNARTLLNLGILLLVIVLGALVFFSDGKETPGRQPALLPVNAGEVHTIVIEGPQPPALRFEKQTAGWHMSQPLDIMANQQRMASILKLINQTSHAQYKVAGADLSKYGLDPAPVNVFLNEHEVSLGGTDPIHQRRYVLVDDAVHLVTDRYGFLLSADPGGFVSPALLPGEPPIHAIQLPGLTVTLQDSKWRMEPAPPEELSQDTLQTFVDEWRYARALNVTLTDQPPRTASEKQVVIETQGGETLRFALLSKDNETVLQRTDKAVQYHLSDSAAERLLHLENNTDK